MTLRIELTSPEQARLQSEASRLGLTLREYATRQLLGKSRAMPDHEAASFEAWRARFVAWSTGHRTDIPLPPPEALEREALYEGCP